jgi:endonuclease/exonuclease/phosphatase family metal-dependent hydrolase
MRVVTQNLLGRQQNWPDRRCALVAGLRALDPDVALFQEAIVTDDHDQPADLLGEGYHLAHHGIRDADGSGISIASRWPLGAVRELDLQTGARTADFPASALAVDVHWPAGEVPLLLVNHKPSWATDLEHEREAQAVTTARFVEKLVARTGQHVVLGGDLDAMPDAASIRFWRGLQSLHGTSVSYRDAWELRHRGEPGHTFAPSASPLITEQWATDVDRRIDYLFVRCGRAGPTLAVRHCARTFDEPVDGAWGSDHFGLVAELEEPDHASGV